MEKYIIKEIYNIDCDNYGDLIVEFTLEDDSEGSYRILGTENYYYFAKELAKENEQYFTKEWEEGDFEDEGYYMDQFDFREWKEYEHSEEMVKEFIYKYYTKEELPQIND